MPTLETVLICLGIYAVLFIPLYLFIRGASRCVYLTPEEWKIELKVYNEQLINTVTK